MQQHARCGWLYRVLRPGRVSPDWSFELAQRGSTISIHEAMFIMFGNAAQPATLAPDAWRRLYSAEGLSESWRKTLENRLRQNRIESWQARLEGPAV